MQNGGQRNSQGRDMSQRIEVCRACAIAYPQPFLTCGFEARIVTLALCTQGVDVIFHRRRKELHRFHYNALPLSQKQERIFFENLSFRYLRFDEEMSVVK